MHIAERDYKPGVLKYVSSQLLIYMLTYDLLLHFLSILIDDPQIDF